MNMKIKHSSRIQALIIFFHLTNKSELISIIVGVTLTIDHIAIGKSFLVNNNLEEAEKSFGKAFDAVPSGRTAYEIATIYEQTANDNKEHLSQCIKWHMRGIRLQNRNCAEKLLDLFENTKLEFRFRNILIPNTADSIPLISKTSFLKTITAKDAVELAKDCCREKKLPIIEDSFLYNTEKKSDLQQELFAQSIRSSIRLGR